MKEVKSRTTWYVCPETGQEREPEPEPEPPEPQRDAETGQYRPGPTFIVSSPARAGEFCHVVSFGFH